MQFTENGHPDTPRPVGWRYRCMSVLLAPLVAVLSARLAWRHRELRYLTERMGWRCPAAAQPPLWLHAASVGEVLALKPLILALHARYPQQPLLLTTTTPTGAAIAARQLDGVVTHRYLPWDTAGATRRFLDRVRPRCSIVMETELWPTLYAACRRRGIAPLVINGRLSAKTLGAGAWLRQAYRSALSNSAAILARSAADADAFRALGAPPERIHAVGNIKLAPPHPGPGDERPALHPAYVLAASTHDDEELRIARLWLALAPDRHLLVIAPRHPQRGAALAAQLKTLTPALAVRSRGEMPTAATRLYLADTLGEMPWLMRHARVVVMGGSFVPRGGHNVLEPAHLGKAVVTGPHMENFQEEAALLREAGALRQVAGVDDLAAALAELLGDAERRGALERAARDALAPYRGIVAAYLDAIGRHCGCA